MFIIDVFVYIVNKKLKIIILKVMDNSEIIIEDNYFKSIG